MVINTHASTASSRCRLHSSAAFHADCSFQTSDSDLTGMLHPCHCRQDLDANWLEPETYIAHARADMVALYKLQD